MSESKSHQTALIVFAKRPHIGHGKQRLAVDIGSEKAYVIAQLLLERTIEIMNKWSGPLVISPSNIEDTQWAAELCSRELMVIPQLEGSLGKRLEQVDSEVRMLNITDCIYIGTDAPLLKIQDLKAIKQALTKKEQVFLPATDGGVVAMASCVAWKGLQTVTWSTKKVCKELKSLGAKQGLSMQVMQTLSDVDDLVSLNEIKKEIKSRTKQSKALFHLNQLINEA